jgi:class 3 adenylate cyclase
MSFRRLELDNAVGAGSGDDAYYAPHAHTGGSSYEVRTSWIAVHVTERVCLAAGRGQVLVTRTVVDLVAGAGISFDDQGEHAFKGVSARWRLFAVKPQ